MVNLKAMIATSTRCFEVLLDVLGSTQDIVSSWVDENHTKIDNEANFYRFFAMTMRAKDCKDWFKADDQGECKIK